jgi:zinc protease
MAPRAPFPALPLALATTALCALAAAGPLAAATKALPKVAARPAKAAPFLAFPFPVEVKTLKNGLRIALVPYDSPGLVAYYTVVRVGSRNETEKGRSGYAHFFEHMMFRGTKAHSGEEYNATVTRLGLNTNAFTETDETVYHLYGPTRSLPVIIEYEADRFRNLEFTLEQFKTEAGAILGEYAKSASSPETLLSERLQEVAFDKHTYKHTVIGYLADIKAMPTQSGFDYARDFFKRYYTPDNATVVIVGDFDHDKTLKLLEANYGGWTGKLKAQPIAAEPPQKKARRAHVEWDQPTLQRTWVAWHAPGAADLKGAALEQVLGAYLFGPTSPLYQDLVLTRQLVDGFDSTASVQRDPTLFGALARLKKDEDGPAVEKAITAAVAELTKGKVDAQRLSGVISNARYSAVLGLDKADAVAFTLAVSSAYTGDLNFQNKLYAQLEKVSASDLVAFARRWLVENNRVTVTLAAKKEAGK